MTDTKQCQGCNAQLPLSDPDVHGHDSRNPVQGRHVDSGAGRREPGEDFAYAVESEDEWI